MKKNNGKNKLTDTNSIDEIIQEKNRAQSYLDIAGVMLVALDTDEKVTLINQKGCEILGYDKNKIVGKNWSDNFVPKRLRKNVKSTFAKIMKQELKSTEFFENPVLTKDGGEHIISWHNSIIRDNKGNITGTLSSGEDITERKKIEGLLLEEKDFGESIIDTAQVIILVLDVNGNIVRFNRYMEELSGYKLKDVKNKSWFDTFLSKANRIETKKLFEKAIEYTHAEGNINPIITQNGREIMIEWHDKALVDSDGCITGLLAIGQDVTKRKKAEEILKHHKEVLEKLVREKTDELVESHKKLAAAKRLSDIGMLAATIAHELRNPLGVIQAALYNIKRERQNPSLDNHLKNINKKINESNQIIRNLLSYSHIKKPHYEKIKLSLLLDECIKDMSSKHWQQTVKIHKKIDCSRDIEIEADRLHLIELFYNLLDNAYNALLNKKGVIDIKLNYNPEKNTVTVTMEDNGVGISRNDLPRIYEPFFTKNVRGIGLGLTVCSQVMERIGGSIQIESKPGVGTIVKAIFPITKKDIKSI